MTLSRDREAPMVDEPCGIRRDAVEVPWPVAARARSLTRGASRVLSGHWWTG